MSRQKFSIVAKVLLLTSIILSISKLASASKNELPRHGFTYNHWDKDGNLITESNYNNNYQNNNNQNKQSSSSSSLNSNIVSAARESINTIQNQFKSQQEYVCGRAIANKKYKDILLDNSNYQSSSNSNRAKYRPIEIRMPRIIGGDETEPGEFPWTISVKLNDQPICGGSLIDRSWVLTAAHCVVGYNPKNLTIRLGAYRIKDLSETQTIDLPVSMFIVHKEYSMPRPFSNDIALIKLNESVELTDYIIPICLPTEDQASATSDTNFSDNNYPSSTVTTANKLNRVSGNSVYEYDDESGGVVVSTKMSDSDIAKCFNRLEQNYLNSIGLGNINDGASTTESATPQVSAPTQSDKNVFSTFANPLDQSSSIFLTNNDKENEIIFQQNNKIKFIQQQHQKQKHKLHNHYEAPIAIQSSYDNINHNNNNEYVYYPGFPWNSGRLIGSSYLMSNDRHDDQDSRRDRIKISRLPISKELLHEIQSVGSNSMPSLNIGPQQGDFVAMANDLTTMINVAATTGEKNVLRRGSSIRTTVNSNYEEEMDNNVINVDSTKYSGLSGTVVGWGWIREIDGEDHVSNNNKGYPSVTLQKVKLPILRNDVCEAWFQSQSKKITLLPSQFCAGFNFGGKDACRGDSGGPMIIEDNSDTGRYKLIGIVSAGIGCARPSLPGLYTRVASFIPWINAQLLRY